MIQTITIKAVEQSQTKTGNTKITLKDDSHKYSFYKNKKDGGFSKAYEQWKDLQDSPVVVAEVKSEEQSFTNAQGKAITYMSNMIMYFDTKNAPQSTVSVPEPQNTSNTIYNNQAPQNAPQEPTSDIIGKIRVAFSSLKQEVEYLKAENKILVDKVQRLEEKFQGLYAVMPEGKQDAFDLHSNDANNPHRDIPIIEETKIEEVPY